MAALLLAALPASGRPGKPFRVVATDSYTVNVQKNGRIDVNRLDNSPIMGNASTGVRYGGEDEIHTLGLAGQSSGRFEVRDALGQGKGVMLQSGRCEVYIRAYPTQPFLTVQQILINDTKKPMTVSALIPWQVDASSKGTLDLGVDPDRVQILENGRLLEEGTDLPQVVTGESRSQWNLCAWNRQENKILVAGFITHDRALSQINLQRSGKAKPGDFGSMQALCVYDPPVILAPGERLASEVLYLGVSEGSPHMGLERYAKAMAIMNGGKKDPPFLVHGWDSWSTKYHKDISESLMLENLEVLARDLAPYGWKHFAIDAGWERGLGDWEANPEKFPHGMAWMAQRIHEKGLTAGIWMNPFTLDLNGAVAQAHPDWIAPKNARGKLLLGDDQGILDVTAPGALDWVRALGHKLGEEWGFDALVEVDFVYHLLLAESFQQQGITGVAAVRMGMTALREGFGQNRFIMTTTPQMVNGLLADGIRTGSDCKPVWESRAKLGPFGAVETLSAAIRRYYMSPVYAMDQDCVFFGHDSSIARWDVTREAAVTPAQSLAWLSGAALTGGVIKIGEPFVDLSAEEKGRLQKLLPVADHPARPLDLFQSAPPSIWHLPLQGPAGDWHILGLFNWDTAAEKQIEVAWPSMGLNGGDYYTVFEFWNETYHGAAQEKLAVSVPPGSVRLFGLRKYAGTPTLMATNRHFAQGALDHGPVTWDEASRSLRGELTAIPANTCTLYIVAPAAMTPQSVESDAAETSFTRTGDIIAIRLTHPAPAALHWIVQF
ncbi:MAG: alpha-galactosidase [Candidatus Hydrogenedentes bacterium]|nr:alpha-galactosidase [Candidatus Hydrogenedentota bacterium]